jgi:hypothetical protein
MSQHPKILSTEDLDTSDAKCVRNSHPQGRPLNPRVSLKMGKFEEDKLARRKGKKGEKTSHPYLCPLLRLFIKESVGGRR